MYYCSQKEATMNTNVTYKLSISAAINGDFSNNENCSCRHVSIDNHVINTGQRSMSNLTCSKIHTIWRNCHVLFKVSANLMKIEMKTIIKFASAEITILPLFLRADNSGHISPNTTDHSISF